MKFLVVCLLFCLAALAQVSHAVECDGYIKVIDSFPDGYRARLSLPVLKNSNSWKLEIELDKPLTVFDTPHGDIEGNKKSGSQINITSLRHNGRLQASTTFTLECTMHHPRSMIPRPKIQRMRFGEFVCEPKETTTPGGGEPVDCLLARQLPNCNSLIQKISIWPDGYRAKVTVPVNNATNSWKMLLIFNKNIQVLDFPQGDLQSKVNNTEFTVKSKDYNGKLKAGTTFTFDMTIHYKRGQTWTNLVAIIFDPAGYICANEKYREILYNRYKGVRLPEAIAPSSKKSCEDNLKYAVRFPDGFTAEMTLPVAKDMSGWKVLVKFDQNVTTLDIADADILGAKKSGNSFSLVNKQHNSRLAKGAKLKLTFTVHYHRTLDPKPQITEIKFEGFECESSAAAQGRTSLPLGAEWLSGCSKVPPTPAPLPDCKVLFRPVDTWPDGVRGYLKIPIKRSVNGWNVTVYYDQKITTFDVFQADKIVASDGRYFVLRNHQYNAQLKEGTEFDFGITIHYPRNMNPKPEITYARFNNEDICEVPDEDCKE